jgi:hypothetical protein
MLRWLALAVFSIVSTAGCGSSVQSGLANAPRLGGTPTVDNRVSDVISNGPDACGVYAEHGVLRNQVPPCPTWTPIHPLSGWAWPAASEAAPSGGLVEPWLNHFYLGWPCSPRSQASRMQSIAWSAKSPTVIACSVP